VERYSLNLPYAYLPEKIHHGTVKAPEIKLDGIKGCFNPSLERYKSVHIVTLTALKPVEFLPTNENAQCPTPLHDLVSTFNYCKEAHYTFKELQSVKKYWFRVVAIAGDGQMVYSPVVERVIQ
jgi:hypothetical protein